MSTGETCGDVGGRTQAGRPCKRLAKEGGRCELHRGQRVLQILPTTEPFEPESLHPAARAVWGRYESRLEGLKRVEFTLMCMAVDQAYRAYEETMLAGTTLPDPVHAGNTKVNPSWRVFREAQAAAKSWAEHFGDTLDEAERRSGIAEIRRRREMRGA